MTIISSTRWKGGTPADMAKAAGQAKALWLKHGAESVAFSRAHTGPYIGDWQFLTRFTDWAAFGKAQQGIAHDADFQALMQHVLGMATLADRTIYVGIEV